MRLAGFKAAMEMARYYGTVISANLKEKINARLAADQLTYDDFIKK